MNTKLLGMDEFARIESIIAAHGLDGFDAEIRFWGRGKSIHVSGDVGQQELACLLAIANYLNGNDVVPAMPPLVANEPTQWAGTGH